MQAKFQFASHEIDDQRPIKIAVTIPAHERDARVYVEGVRAAVTAVARGDLDPEPLYTHSFALDQIGSAFETMRSRPDRFLKALITL